MGWVGANKDLLGVSIAFLAILVSLTTVMISRRNAQVNSFIAIQSVMLSGDLQRGRLLIYKAVETGAVPPRDSEDAYLMVRSLAVFDLLGTYARRRIVPRRWVLEFWHARLQILRHGYGLDADSSGFYPIHGRPDLLDLIERAEHYRCDRACCSNGQRERRLLGPGEGISGRERHSEDSSESFS